MIGESLRKDRVSIDAAKGFEERSRQKILREKKSVNCSC